MAQPTQSSIHSIKIPGYDALFPKNADVKYQEAKTIEDIIPDFVLEEILLQLFTFHPTEALCTVRASRQVCRRWHHVVSDVFLKNPITAIPVIQRLFDRLGSRTEMHLPSLPSYIRLNPIIRDMYAPQDIKRPLFIQRLVQVLERDASPTCERSFVVAQALLASDICSSVPFFCNGSREIKNNKKFVLIAVKNEGRALEHVASRLKDDKDVVMAAVQDAGFALEHASSRLKDDKDIVMAAMQDAGFALEHASSRLKDDKDIVMAAMQNAGFALEHASSRLKDDKDIVMAAMQNFGGALEHASLRLRDDRDVVMAAVQNFGWALEYASLRLRDDREIVMAAVRNYRKACAFASPRLRCSIRNVWFVITQNLEVFLRLFSC